jgi:hypothetical protein
MRSQGTRPRSFRHIVGMPCLVNSWNAGDSPDILNAATLCIQRYGSEAALIAWGVADGYALEGDLYNHHAWLLVMDEIEAMNTRTPRGGQRNPGPGLGPRL